MPFGIFLNGCKLVDTQANFCIPSITSNYRPLSTDTSLASHFLLNTDSSTLPDLKNEVLLLRLPPNVTVLVRLPKWSNFIQLYSALKSLSLQTAIISPVIDNKDYFSLLQSFCFDLPENPGLVLELGGPVSSDMIKRYKCLRYMAVSINQYTDSISRETYESASILLAKLASPVLLLDEETCKSKSSSFWTALSQHRLPHRSDMFIDPLQPLTAQMDLDVYETFEKDHTKYSQYDAAIEMALSDLSISHSLLNVLVIGPGRGPLLKLVMQHSRSCDKVVVVERNPKCQMTLAELCKAWPDRVELIFGDIRELSRGKLSSFHLVVSELLGSFGCNEAAPEILRIFEGLRPVMIPQEFRSLVQPIYTDVATEKWQNRPHLALLNSYFPVGDPKPAFEFVYPGENSLDRRVDMGFSSEESEVANGLYCYFEALLYGPYKIAITPGTSLLEFCTSWFPILFPIQRTRLPISVTIYRKSDSHLSYEWTVNGEIYGSDYLIDLS